MARLNWKSGTIGAAVALGVGVAAMVVVDGGPPNVTGGEAIATPPPARASTAEHDADPLVDSSADRAAAGPGLFGAPAYE